MSGEKHVDVKSIEVNSIILLETEDDMVYELVKNPDESMTIIGGRRFKNPTPIHIVSRKIQRGKPIKFRYEDNTIITNKVVSMKITTGTYSIEIWEEAVNENFGPG